MNVIATHALPVTNSAAFDSPFFAMTPGPLLLLLPTVILATVATVIASQALISGAFTLTARAIDRSLWPRLTVRHTSTSQKGQVFVPSVNIVLAIAVAKGTMVFPSGDVRSIPLYWKPPLDSRPRHPLPAWLRSYST